jgi:hypothetical protein
MHTITGLNKSEADKDLLYGYTVVPVHTTPSVHDIAVRGYEKCPTYNSALATLYKSAEFLAYEQQQRPFFDDLLVSTYNTYAMLHRTWQ